MAEKPRVYVAGPYTSGDVAVNVRRAITTGDWLFSLGCIPFVPHFSHFSHLILPRPYEDWMEIDLAWLPCCHALFRMSGDSPGADRECSQATDRGIPVLRTREELVEWMELWRSK